MRPLFVAVYFCFTFTATIGNAQTRDSKPDSPSPAVREDTPIFALEFKDGKPVPGIQGSEIMAYPMACSPDGVAFADEIVSPKTMERSIVSLDEKGGHVFSLKSVPDLFDLRLISFFPSDSSVAFLVTATADSKTSTIEARLPTGDLKSVLGNSSSHHSFIVLFDRSGNYKSTIELPGSSPYGNSANVDYKKVALFPSGEFLLLGFNSMNRVASLHITDARGEFIRSIEIPDQMMQDSLLAQGVSGGPLERSKASTSLSTWQFAASGQNIVLYQPNVQAPLLELGATGLVRQVPVSLPTDYTLDALIAGSGRWIARFRKSGISYDKAVDSSVQSNNFLLYELNRLDGSLKMRLDENGADFSFGITCESDGVLTAVNLGEGSKFVASKADLPK